MNPNIFSSALRIRILLVLVAGFAVVLAGRLYYLQIVQGQNFADKAERQYVRPNTQMFDRGTIFFSKKDGAVIAGATLQAGFTVAANPKQISDPENVYEKINAIVPMDKAGFLAGLAKPGSVYDEILKKVGASDAQKIAELKIAGISLYKDKWRYYPGGKIAGNALGFVGYDSNDKLSGRYGLEKYYNETLARPSDTSYTNFFAQIFSDLGDTLTNQEKLQGDIVSTIEPSAQSFIEDQLGKLQKQYSPDSSGAIVMDPKTGEVNAMAVLPAYDPNSFQTEKNVGVFGNPIISGVYEMGSIIKPLTMAAGIDSGAVTADTTYNDAGSVVLDGLKISNFDGKGRGTVNMQEVLNQSLNTGAVFVMQAMGKNLFADYMKNYGLGEETGIDLPNEAPGMIENLKSPRDVEYATASFGQGIAMTPIETARALCALGNGGFLPNPHIVKTINYKLGFSKNLTFGDEKQVLKKTTSDEITRMLVNVVDKALLGGKAMMKNYSIAAKTGTAQISNPAGGGYYADRWLHSFFGYFPAYNPRFLVFLYMVNPKGVAYASHTLTEPFSNIAKFLINYYEIPPDR